LGCIDPQPLPWRVTRWKSINTDNMHQVFETATIPVGNNVPRLSDMPLSPNDYINELVQGFEQMYRFLVQHRLILLSEASPLAGLQAQQVRFIFRPTRVYSVLLQKTLTPEFLQNGVDRSIELDILTRMLLTSRTKPIAWSILQAELQAMEQLDIPYFASYADSDALTIGVENSIQKYFQATGYEQIIERLKHLSENDLVQQIAIIRGTFYARVAKSSKSLDSELNKTVRPVTGLTSQKANCLEIIPLTHNQLLADAQDIAEEIYSHAIQEADGATRWIGLNYIPKAERYQFQPLDESLYNGNCGIALFLAALDYVKGGNQFRNLALSSLQYTCRVLQTNHPDLMQQFARKIGIGGATGLGSIIYSFAKISHLLQEPALIEDAREFSNLITTELLATDQQFDVTYGAAGGILGLLALYNETGDAVVLEKAIACGQHLLKHRISIDGSPRAWKKLENKPLTGFSHGAAGIAYSLLQLHAVTRDSIYLEAACEGIAYERSVFSTKAANWPDFRFLTQPNAQPSFEVSWCHGAPGIGLARLGGLSILQTEEIYQDVEVALQNIQQHSLHTVDHICCGNFGRIEVLLAAAQKLSRPDLLEMAQQKAALVVARAKQTGGYQLFANLPNHVFSPSFFQGTAGIGYELLRLASPSKLPSVLLWE
jgi:type 2 lantibiotic biosynthesis protein LanM